MKDSRPRDRLGRPQPRGTRDALQAEDPEQLGSDEAIERRAYELCRSARFFEAHEMFEHLWKRQRSAAWRALAQLAVGCCHWQRGNTEGAVRLLERGAAGLGTREQANRARALATRIRASTASEEDLVRLFHMS